jgi:hypothetical protein
VTRCSGLSTRATTADSSCASSVGCSLLGGRRVDRMAMFDRADELQSMYAGEFRAD